jgi:ribosomal protein L37E
MRAHLNPTRMKSLTVLAERLSQRLAALCPGCNTPGFGRTGARNGLICEECGAPTGMVAAETFGCAACDYTEERARQDGLTHAEPVNCPECNP